MDFSIVAQGASILEELGQKMKTNTFPTNTSFHIQPSWKNFMLEICVLTSGIFTWAFLYTCFDTQLSTLFFDTFQDKLIFNSLLKNLSSEGVYSFTLRTQSGEISVFYLLTGSCHTCLKIIFSWSCKLYALKTVALIKTFHSLMYYFHILSHTWWNESVLEFIL